MTGHEFHRTAVEPCRGAAAAWLVDGEPAGFSADPARVGRETVHASYLHVHWAGYPDLAQRFTDAVHAHARTMRVERPAMRPEQKILRPSPRSRALSTLQRALSLSRGTLGHRNRPPFMIYTTTETGTLPKDWWTLPSMSA